MKDPSTDLLDQRELEKQGEPAEGLLSLPLGKDPAKTMLIGASLPKLEWGQLFEFLKDNADIFAWTSSDMPRIPPKVITHKVNINSNIKPIQ